VLVCLQIRVKCKFFGACLCNAETVATAVRAANICVSYSGPRLSGVCGIVIWMITKGLKCFCFLIGRKVDVTILFVQPGKAGCKGFESKETEIFLLNYQRVFLTEFKDEFFQFANFY